MLGGNTETARGKRDKEEKRDKGNEGGRDGVNERDGDRKVEIKRKMGVRDGGMRVQWK